MKYFEQEFYQKPFLAYLASCHTKDYWLKTKDYWLRGFKHVTKRHRRSMRYTDMMALIGDNDNYRFTRIGKEIGRRKHGKWLYMPKRIKLE